jgi:hypothetical protein
MTLSYYGLRVFLLDAIFAACSFAQFESASLKGAVTSGTGTPLKGVTIIASNEATGAIEKVVSDAGGVYLFPSLRPESYFIPARAGGFKELIVMKYALQINQAARSGPMIASSP